MKLLNGFFLLMWGLLSTEAFAALPDSLSQITEIKQLYSLEELEEMEMLPPLGFTLEVDLDLDPNSITTAAFQIVSNNKNMVVINWNNPAITNSFQVYNGMGPSGTDFYEDYSYDYPINATGKVLVEIMVCPDEVLWLSNSAISQEGVISGADISLLPNLEHFKFSNQSFSTIDISSNPKITNLVLMDNLLSGVIDLSSAASSLVEIHFGETKNNSSKNNSITKLIPFQQSTIVNGNNLFPFLKNLEARYNNLGENGDTHFWVDGCPNLETLNLGDNESGNPNGKLVDVHFALSMPSLDYLELRFNNIPGNFDLSSCPVLSYVNIWGNDLTGITLNCPATLQFLVLQSNEIVSSGFPDLSTYANLELINASTNKLGDDTNHDISDKLPDPDSYPSISWKLTTVFFGFNDFTTQDQENLIDVVYKYRCVVGSTKRFGVRANNGAIKPSQVHQDKVNSTILNTCAADNCGTPNTNCTLISVSWTSMPGHLFY